MTKLSFHLTPFLLAFLVFSCSSLPKATHPSNREIKRFNNVAVNVTSADILVKYKTEQNQSLIVVALGPLFWGLEYLSRAAVDSNLAVETREIAVKSYCENMLAKIFLENLVNEKVFKSINYSNTIDKTQLKKSRLDSLIYLKIEELSLRKHIGETLKVYSRISGEMIDLERDEIIWKQQETILSDESFLLEEFKADNGKQLRDTIDKIFKKVALRFSLDIAQ